MNRFSALCLVCGLLAISCVSAAPRSEELIDEVMDVIKAQDWVTPDVKVEPAASTSFLVEAEDKPFHILLKYMIPPAQHKDFAKKWLSVQKGMEGKHGNTKMNLYKIYGDTTILLSHQEWETRRAFNEGCQMKEIKPLYDWVKSEDVTVHLVGMSPIDDMSHAAAAHSPSDSSAFGSTSFSTLEEHMVEPAELESLLESGHTEEYRPVIVSKFCVRPSKQEDFTSAFLDTKKRMLDDESKAVNAICLAKTHDDNVCYMGYEEWESREQLHDHFRSGIHKDWMRFVHENNIGAKVCMAVEVKDMSPFDY